MGNHLLYSLAVKKVCSSAVGYTHLSSLDPCGSLLFNTCPESCSLRTILSRLCEDQLLVFPMGMSWTMQCTGHLLPPAGADFILFNFHIQSKVAENRLFLFIHTEIGWICISSQNNPEIWLHSIPQPLEQKLFIFLLASSQEYIECVSMHTLWVHLHSLVCLWRMCAFVYISVSLFALVNISVCGYFRRRSCKPAWSYWGIFSAITWAIQQIFLTVLRFTTEWPT